MSFPKLINPENGLDLHLSQDSNNKYFLQDKYYPSTYRYQIIKNIPRILIPIEKNYSQSFGHQWKRWKKTQLDSHTKLPISERRLLRCLTEKGVELIKNSDAKLNLLEVGCGAGRFTEILLKFPSLKITSFDLSEAIEVNQENFPQSDSHRIIQADINHSPFEKCKFNIVLCLGVIQHTPNPEKTIKNLYEQVMPGGLLVFDHYTPNLSRKTKITANLIRPFLKRINNKYQFKVIEFLVNIFLPIHRSIKSIPFAQKIFSRISPLLTYYNTYPELPEHLQKEWALLDTHDSLTDWFKHFRTRKDIFRYLSKLGAKEIYLNKDGNGIEAFCIKPIK